MCYHVYKLPVFPVVYMIFSRTLAHASHTIQNPETGPVSPETLQLRTGSVWSHRVPHPPKIPTNRRIPLYAILMTHRAVYSLVMPSIHRLFNDELLRVKLY